MNLWDLLSPEAQRLIAGLMIAAPFVIFACVVLSKMEGDRDVRDRN